ncbi:hypothetical protein OAB57_00265 [Bacteriovoracaceae bacterium]|nr:hypothetical protein [Bacteriovoracaceae bacterium]
MVDDMNYTNVKLDDATGEWRIIDGDFHEFKGEIDESYALVL